MMRQTVPHHIRIRLESSRVVVYSLVAGVLVGILGVVLRGLLDLLAKGSSWLFTYQPPGTPGEGGLLQTFGQIGPELPWNLIFIPVLLALGQLIRPYSFKEPLEEAIASYHNSYQTSSAAPSFVQRIRSLLTALINYFSGTAVGRDSPFTALGNLSASILGRLLNLHLGETRILSLACVAAALGLVLHAPLPAAVMMVEILYRRFDFETSPLLSAVLASVTAYALYGGIYGFNPLVSPELLQAPALSQVPLYALLGLGIGGVAWLLAGACKLLPSPPKKHFLPICFAFGLLTLLFAYFVPASLSDGTGWWQLTLQGFQNGEALTQGALRLILLLGVIWLGLGGTLLSALSTGGLIGAGIASVFPGIGLDPIVSSLVGAAAFITTLHNIPVAATLLLVSWGGDALLPALLGATLLAHTTTGEASILFSQLSGQKSTSDSVSNSVPESNSSSNSSTDSPEKSSEPNQLSGQQQIYRLPLPKAWNNLLTTAILWPAEVEFVAIVRNGEVHLAHPEQTFAAGDEIMVLASPDSFQDFAKTLLELHS